MKTVSPFGCLNPIEITLPNGEKNYVPCRHCKACMLSVAKFNTLRCDIESLSNKYQFFITLTYDRKSLPIMKYVKVNRTLPLSGEGDEFFDIQNERLNCRKDAYHVEQVDGRFRFPFHRPKGFKLKEYYKRSKIRYKVAVLCKYDLQIFFKNLRNKIHKLNKEFDYCYDEGIRYYAVGEYGPKTLRPHYHVLLFTNSDFVASILQQILCEAWPYGIVDTQISKGKASDYVASYVNSRLLVPSFLNVIGVRPFQIHSRYFGETLLREKVEKVYSSPFANFIEKSFVLHEKYVTVNTWRSIQDYYFPKCMGFMYYDSATKYNLYTIYHYASRKYKESSVSNLARCLYLDCDVVFSDSPALNDFMTFFRSTVNSNCGVSSIYDVNKDLYDGSLVMKENKVLSFLYSFLYTSYRFCHIICGDNPNLFYSRISVIEDFYKFLDYYNLSNYLKKESSFFDNFTSPFDVNDYLEYFYTNYAVEKYGTIDFYNKNCKTSKLYIAYENKINDDFRSATKHKELNDELKIWLKTNKLL